MRNRAAIVTAARAAVTADGDLRLNAVAKAAGVGQGTLYRHFATREDLLAEVYRDDVAQLVNAASVFLDGHTAWRALALWLERVADYAAVKRGVMAAVEKSLWLDLTSDSLGPIGAAITLLLEAGRTEGSIRADIDARDVILLIGYLSRLEPTDTDERARHLLTVVLSGLRAEA